MKKNLFFLSLLAAVLLSAGCSKKSDSVVFDNSDPFATKPGVEWVLVISPYVACHKNADYESEVSQHLRKGAIRMVSGTKSVKIDGNYEKWYSLEEGWVPENSVSVYSNKLKAQKAFKEL